MHYRPYKRVICCLLTEARAQLHKHRAVDSDFEELEVGKIKRHASLLTDNDARYAGKRVSRRDIEEQVSADCELSHADSELSDSDDGSEHERHNDTAKYNAHHFVMSCQFDRKVKLIRCAKF